MRLVFRLGWVPPMTVLRLRDAVQIRKQDLEATRYGVDMAGLSEESQL